jgi:hypothetical protein
MSRSHGGGTHQLESFLDDPKAGQPERYSDYVHETYGRMFRSGSVQALETFRDLLRQVLAIGNERSILLFAERFFPLLPHDARHKIFGAFFTELQTMKHRTEEENVKRRQELLKTTNICIAPAVESCCSAMTNRWADRRLQ